MSVPECTLNRRGTIPIVASGVRFSSGSGAPPTGLLSRDERAGQTENGCEGEAQPFPLCGSSLLER